MINMNNNIKVVKSSFDVLEPEVVRSSPLGRLETFRVVPRNSSGVVASIVSSKGAWPELSLCYST